MKISDVPDLPALKYVKLNEKSPLPNWQVIAILLVYGSLFLPIIILTFLYWKYIVEVISESNIYAVPISVALIILVIIKSFFRFGRYETTPDGIIMRSSFRSKIIYWQDIKNVILKVSDWDGWKAIIQTSNGKITLRIGLFNTRTESAMFVLSLIQNLRSTNRIQETDLEDRLADLWRDVPENISSEINWVRRKNIFNILSVPFAIIAALVYILYMSQSRSLLFIIFISFPISGFVVMIYFQVARTIYRIEANDEYINLETLYEKKRFIWQEIESLTKRKEEVILIFKSGYYTNIKIKLSDEKDRQLILKLIKNVRNTGKIVSFPESLISPPVYHPNKKISDFQKTNLRQAFLIFQTKDVRFAIKSLINLCVFPALVSFIFTIFLMQSKYLVHYYNLLYFQPDTIIVLPFQEIIAGMLCGLLLGLVIAAITYRLTFTFAGKYLDKWVQYNNIGISNIKDAKYYKNRAVAYILIAIFVYASVTFLFLNNYIRVRNDGIGLNSALSFKEQEYNWSQVDSVICNLDYDNSGHSNISYSIKFDNGKVITISEQNIIGEDRSKVSNAIQLIAKKSGKKVIFTRKDD